MSSPGSTGFGITEEGRRKGIYTMAEKLEKICPFYNRMDAVFGSRQNITPACVLETGVRGEIFPAPTPNSFADKSESDEDSGEEKEDEDDEDYDGAEVTQEDDVREADEGQLQEVEAAQN